MHEFFCGLTAFQLYRTPPLVQMLCPCPPDISSRLGKFSLRFYDPYLGGASLPLHILVTKRSDRRVCKHIAYHLWTGELPPGAFQDSDTGITLISPLFTLLTMASHLSCAHLAMAMFELCGDFTVFRPAPEIQERLDACPPFGNWSQSLSASGRPTSLWRRPPLIAVEELRDFAERLPVCRGGSSFRRASSWVTGITSSPFEVQASMLLSLPRHFGGEGISGLQNNRRIALNTRACTIAQRKHCIADIYLEPQDGPPIDLELHGRLYHDGGQQPTLDANRTLALQTMGIEVMLLTYEQITDARRFHTLASYLRDALGLKAKPKSDVMDRAETQLRAQLFIDWETLGT